jgi:hypothetical protein
MDDGYLKLERELLHKIDLIQEVRSKIDLIHEFRALLTSIQNCPYSNVKQYHKNQIDDLLSRKFKGKP